MKNFYFLLAFLFTVVISLKSHAQEYKFGKITKEELLEESYKGDSTANAAVLFENKKIYYDFGQQNGFRIVTEVFRRIKIYNNKGFDHATHEIYLYKENSNAEKISGLKGITYNLKDGAIEETKLKKSEIFEEEYSEYNNQVKFTMPSLKEGSVIDYKYKIISPFYYSIDKMYLQNTIPIKQLKTVVQIPEYFNFKKFTTGYLPIQLKESSFNSKITLTSKTRSGGQGFTPSSTNFSSRDIDHRVNVYNITSQDVPAFREEPYSGNPDNYLSSIVFELQFVKFPNSKLENFSTTWEAVVKSIYKDPRFGGELEKTSYFKEDLKQLLKSIDSPVEKAALIYNFVKTKMNWNEKYSVVSNHGVKKAYKEGVGNAAEVNFILIAMLKYAKIKATPVLVSSIKKTTALFPTLKGFDYVVARVQLGDKYMYLDATDKYGEPNILPNRVIHGSGRIISENGSTRLVTFRPKTPSLNRLGIQCEVDSDGAVKGKTNLYYKDYLAHNFRLNYSAESQETMIKRLKQKYEINTLDNYEAKGMRELGKPVIERFDFNLDNQVEVIDDEMFFSPLLFLRDKENVFKSEERRYPIDFGFGYSNTMMISIKIPENYEIVEIPKSSAFRLPENMGNFVYRINKTSNSIQVSITETLNVPFVTADYYPVLKQFYSQIIEKESDQVVLKKI
ncbi:DUF3857 domain-containing protein [Aquimarina algicola]|uniref:DUF3857 domain-containing protein n=1 Tax=Aquimarina algicola TaxID=2589995 RepID=A0A504JHG2_9FLAO|nr:DUF3857 domain-containing protein [Aquimarina algicola]TPN85881.1 DUF3857 domain-containing protein [Aquimarina algicola]